ncbi:hypothetical protein G9C98_001341 [Cotesia typhae]|uniref:Uncharacterized protein n=1 Tax=Cotesia typhae TaxID=2053667 RepID=A0A8J5QSI7_9HYME|nr:hypothetical protein G9C98_001341 [Cotesia typhae]
MPVDFVPRPSLEQLGIHSGMQPNAEVQLRMKRWLGVSSRKVGGWIKWLIDVLGKALWWQAAIKKSLEVVMSIVDAIEFFTRQTKLEEAFNQGNKHILQGKGSGAKLSGREVPRWKRVVESSRSRRPNPNKSLRVLKQREMKSDNKISMRLVQRALFELPLNETPKGIIDKPQRRHLTNDTAEEKDYSEPRDVMETSKKITRPIGVTRPPEELRLRKENFLQVKNENDLSRKKKELEDVFRKLKKDIAIYHSLCKRWKKINEQVIKLKFFGKLILIYIMLMIFIFIMLLVILIFTMMKNLMTKQIIDREIFPPEENYEDERILLYRSLNLDSLLQLRTPTFSEISFSSSDEFLEHKNDREVIVHKNSAKLYFNLQMDQGLPSGSRPGPN